MKTRSSSSRRNVLLASAAALAGVATFRPGMAGASPTQAATPAPQSPLLLGRSNDAQSSATWLYSKVGGIALGVVQKGTGVAAQFLSEAQTGAVGLTRARTRWGLHGANLATGTSTGGGVRAEGGANIGLFADTAPSAGSVPAIVAIGGDGTGTAQVARGTSYLDGDACLLRAWVGVAGVQGQHLAYAPIASAERATHQATGRVTLPSTGRASVTLPDTFRAACDTSTLVVSLTPVGAAMPGLFVSYTTATVSGKAVTTGFVVHGTAKGVVNWTASADRTAMDLSRVPGSATPTKPTGSTGAGLVVDGSSAALRLGRSATQLPER